MIGRIKSIRKWHFHLTPELARSSCLPSTRGRPRAGLTSSSERSTLTDTPGAQSEIIDVGRSPALRHAPLATGALFFTNGCGLGSWVPHIPEVKIWHSLSDSLLGLALLAFAAGAVRALRQPPRDEGRRGAVPPPLLAPDFARTPLARVLRRQRSQSPADAISAARA